MIYVTSELHANLHDQLHGQHAEDQTIYHNLHVPTYIDLEYL